MSDLCVHDDSMPATRTDPACGECELDRDEYENGCEGCPEKYGKAEHQDNAADAAYDGRDWR